MAQHFRVTPVLLVVILLAVLVGWLYWPQQNEQQEVAPAATPVSIAQVERRPFEVTIEALGTANANEAVIITAQTSDVVEQVHFDDGQSVTKGQLLVSLNSREERARVKELKINLAEARRQLKRITDLAKENATSKQLLDEQEARVNALKAQLDVANSRLEELVIRAPFDGQLGIRRISPGALVNPGTQITTLDDVAIIKVDFSVAERHLASLAAGQKITATSAAWQDDTFEGRIDSVDSRVDPVSRAVQVRATIDNREQKLRPGMLLQIVIQKAVLDTLVIPESAIVPIQQQHFVFVLNADNTVSRKLVRIGERKPGWVEVVDGLQSSDQVVYEGALRLRDGSQVQVLEN